MRRLPYTPAIKHDPVATQYEHDAFEEPRDLHELTQWHELYDEPEPHHSRKQLHKSSAENTLTTTKIDETRSSSPSITLSRQECTLLRLWAQGRTDQQAAYDMETSLRTIGRLSANVMYQLGARSRFQAGWLARTHGWVS